MNMSLLEKMGLIFNYMFSSFLSIGILIFSFFLLLILIFNINRTNKIVSLAVVGVYLGFLIGIIISYHDYVKLCLDGFVKEIMNYIYFPSTLVYFFIIVFVTCMMLITIFSKKMTKFKKIMNYCFFSILYFFFMSFVVSAAYDGVDLSNTVELYKNQTILSLVQISNLLLVVWILCTAFYKLFNFYKKKFD